MLWLTHIVCLVVGIAVGMAIGWKQGFRIGRQRPVTEAEFSQLADHRHEWTDWWSGTNPDGSRVRVRGCLSCEEYQTEPLTG